MKMMNPVNRVYQAMMAAGVLLLSAPLLSAQEAPVAEDPLVFPQPAVLQEKNSFYETWVKNRLSVGLRVSSITLTDNDRPEDYSCEKTFLGNINHLENERKTTLYPFIAYQFKPWFGLSLSYDSVRASTRNQNWQKNPTDGDVEMSGLLIMTQFRLPLLEERLFPFVELGLAPWTSKFIHDPNWYDGGRREMFVHTAGDSSLVYALGLAWRPHSKVEISASFRHMEMTADAKYYNRSKGFTEFRKAGEFTLEHNAVCFAAAYRF